MSTNIPEHLRQATQYGDAATVVYLPPISDGDGAQVEVYRVGDDPLLWVVTTDTNGDHAAVRLTPHAATQLAEQIQALSREDQT